MAGVFFWFCLQSAAMRAGPAAKTAAMLGAGPEEFAEPVFVSARPPVAAIDRPEVAGSGAVPVNGPGGGSGLKVGSKNGQQQ